MNNCIFDELNLEAAFDSERNAKAATEVVTVYVCPTSDGGRTFVQGRGPCQYGGIYGERITGRMILRKGP